MEYANGGDLHAYVQRKGHLNEKEARYGTANMSQQEL